jgi:hypothetical protein
LDNKIPNLGTLDTLKLSNIRSLLNHEEQKLKATEGDAFNNDFGNQMNGDAKFDEDPQVELPEDK